MNLEYVQDMKLMCRNVLHFYALIMKQEKEKTMKRTIDWSVTLHGWIRRGPLGEGGGEIHGGKIMNQSTHFTVCEAA